MKTRTVFLPLLLLVPLLGGCASAPFTAAVRQTVPVFTGELRAYAEADATLDVTAKADRLAAADALDASAKPPVTLEPVRQAWATFRALYGPSVDSDGDFSPEEKTLRAANVARFDSLLRAERKRWIYGPGE